MASQDAIERGIALYQELVGELPVLEEELESSQRLFLPHGRPATGLALRRHLEWFLFERPSVHLGGVPAEVLWERWRERAGAEEAAQAATFLQSVSGVFEVSSSESGALWVQDLFAPGEFPIDEPEAEAELQTGDLLVGRIFPVGDGLFRMSPAVMCFRDARLTRAVREDLARMRAERRGVLRIEQLELERLFFAGSDGGESGRSAEPGPPPVEGLVQAGLERSIAEQAVARVRSGQSGGVVTEVLNELAFSSQVDLDVARELLIQVWGTRPAARPEVLAVPDPGGDPRAALAAFDRGRAAGRDLEELFATLARDLGVGSLDDDVEDGGGADFPEVVGAMVAEFLWEIGTEEGREAALALAPAQLFARYAADQSVFENLGRRDVLDYCTRWMLDESGIEDAAALQSALVAFARFCAWCEERHGVLLASALEPFREGLLESVPRLARMRSVLHDKQEEDEVLEVVARDARFLELRPLAGGSPRRLPAGSLLPDVRVGEVVRGRTVGERLEPSGVYPRELLALLELVRGLE